MSALAHPRISEAPQPPLAEVSPATRQPAAEPDHDPRAAHRWYLILGAPFILGAVFFGAAVGFGVEWPMAPAFLLGPLVMIGGYIYLSLTSDSNTAEP